jgi:prepilin-type N-terminal cleavage/methylation domain-containing protein
MFATPHARQRGFSMLELLVVATIIGVIAAIAVPRLLAARRVSHQGRALATLRNIGSAQITFHNSANRYGSFEDLIAARVIPPQFVRAVGGTSGQGEVISDGAYGFGMTFDPDQSTLTIDASPLQEPEKYRFFRFRIGGSDGGASDGIMVILEAEPTATPPPANGDYHVLTQ